MYRMTSGGEPDRMIFPGRGFNKKLLVRPDGAEIMTKGKTGGMPLLMIPGLGGDSECWGGMFPRKLREGGIDPAVYDPRGLGQSSSGSREPSISLYAADAAAVLEDRAPGGAVLGWSMGASVAIGLALYRPDLVTRLILCCGTGDHGMLVRRNPEVFRPILDREAPVAELASVLGSMLLPLDQRGNTSFNRAFLSVIRDSFVRHEEGIRSQQKALAACPPAMSRLNEISVPVLVIMGDRDGLIPPREGENLVRDLPDARLEILSGGHGLIYERPAELAERVCSFLSVPGKDSWSPCPAGG